MKRCSGAFLFPVTDSGAAVSVDRKLTLTQMTLKRDHSMDATAKQQEQQIELSPWQHCAFFLLACAALVARRPDAIFHAQFWAEDGRVWFADAYNFGWWAALFRQDGGYLQTFPRLGASLALLGPLFLAPLVLNLIAIAVQALPVNLLLSSRSSAWGNLRSRAFFASMYLALPNCRELSANIESSQWVLALCAFLLLVASIPRSAVGRLFDLSVLLLCGLTGPFCIFLLPIALFLAWRHRDRWRWVPVGALAALSLVQAWPLLLNTGFSSRPHYALGASPALFTRILAGQVYLGTLLGHNELAAHSGPLLFAGSLISPARLFIFLLCVAIGGTAIVAICFVKSAVEMKLFLLLSTMLLAASLISPTAYPPAGVSVWELLAAAPAIRYWFFPTLAFAWSLLWCFRSRAALLKIVSAYLLILMCIGILRDWRHPAFQDLHFAEYVKRFEAAPVGTTVTIPVNPIGWDLRLVKRSPGQ